MDNRVLKSLLGLLVAASSLLPAKAQQNNQQNQNEQRAHTELLVSPKLDGVNVHCWGVAKQLGLEESSLTFRGNNSSKPPYMLTSNNGAMSYDTEVSWAVVVKNGHLSYLQVIDGDIQEVGDKEIESFMKEVVRALIKTYSMENTEIARVLRAEEAASFKSASDVKGNTPKALKYYDANNRAGSVSYRIDENGALETRGDYVPKGFSYPVAIPKKDNQGYYYLGDNRDQNMQNVRAAANRELNTRGKWEWYCIYLDLVEHRDIDSLTDGEILFITKYKQFLKKYELELDKDNHIRICGSRTIYENINTGYNRI